MLRFNSIKTNEKTGGSVNYFPTCFTVGYKKHSFAWKLKLPLTLLKDVRILRLTAFHNILIRSE